MRRKKKPYRSNRIFSGPYSKSMWRELWKIRDAVTFDAVYLVCCRIQELEARIEAYRLGEPE